MDKDTLIVTDHRKQNKGRGLIIGGALAILAGMYIIDKSSTCYTATDPNMTTKWRSILLYLSLMLSNVSRRELWLRWLGLRLFSLCSLFFVGRKL